MNIVETVPWMGFAVSYFQALRIIRNIQATASETKVNVNQCNSLSKGCDILREWFFTLLDLKSEVRESMCGLWQLVNVLDSAENLVAECTHLETGFFDKELEFAEIFEGVISGLEMVDKTVRELFGGNESGDSVVAVHKPLEELQKEASMLAEASKKDKEPLEIETENSWSLCWVEAYKKQVDYRNRRGRHDLLDVQKNLTIEHQQLLGRGNFETIYKGMWFEMEVAVAVMDKDKDKGNLRVIGKINHPHVLQIFGFCEMGESIYCVMELMDADLKKVIEARTLQRPFVQITAIDIMLQIAKAMAHLHKQHIVHGDLKLTNVLVNNKSLVGHTDSYLIKITSSLPTQNQGYRSSYVAPEMLSGQGSLSEKVDLYSFGVMCAEISLGVTFRRRLMSELLCSETKKRSTETKQKSSEEEIIQNALQQMIQDCPQDVQPLIQSCCNENPDKRPDFQTICNNLQTLKDKLYSQCSRITLQKLQSALSLSSIYTNYSLENLKYVKPSELVDKEFLEGHARLSSKAVQMIERMQEMLNDTKTNVQQCQLFSKTFRVLCKGLQVCSGLESSNEYLLWVQELLYILHRGMFLITECKYIETAFLDRTAEFLEIFANIHYCLKFLIEHATQRSSALQVLDKAIKVSQKDVLDAADKDSKELFLKTKKPIWWNRRINKLMQALVTTIKERGALDRNVLNVDLNKMLGAGTYGQVYRGKLFEMTVAVKRLWPGNERQCKLMGEVSRGHPHLLQIIGYFPAGGMIYCVTEMMETGLDTYLKKFIQKGTDEAMFPLTTAIDIMLQIAKAMSYLHDRDILHRDLKLSNILVNNLDHKILKENGSSPYLAIKVADFGLEGTGLDTVTGLKQSLSYMAPELLSESTNYTKEVDVYSFGIICAEILNGKRFGGSTLDLHSSWNKRPSLPSGRCPTVLQELIQDCWDVDSKRRPNFSTISHVLQGLKKKICFQFTILQEKSSRQWNDEE